MGKKWLIIGTLVIGIILSIICGIYAYNKGSVSDTNIISNKKLADTNQEESLDEKELVNESIPTSLSNINISPNAIIIEKKYYKTCDHLIRKTVDIPEELINKTEEDVKKKYPGWKIEEYTSKEIVVYKEFNDFCDEHYIVRDQNGVICIYTINKEGIETLKESTEISTNYLPSEDLQNLKNGIQVVGKTNLYNFLEDYE